MNIGETWAKATTARMAKGGDLYRRPMTREEMTLSVTLAGSRADVLAAARRLARETEPGAMGMAS